MYMDKAKEYITRGYKLNSIIEGNENENSEQEDIETTPKSVTIENKILYLLIPIIVLVILVCCFYFYKRISSYFPKEIADFDGSLWYGKCIIPHFLLFTVVTMISFLLSILSLFGTKYKDPLNDFHTWGSFVIISFLIFWGTFILIGICTSFVEVFENTIGVSLLDKEKLNEVFNNFKPKVFEEADIDLTYLVRLFNVKNFEYYFDNFMKTAILNVTIENSPFIDLKYKPVNEYDEKTKENKDADKTNFLEAFKDVE